MTLSTDMALRRKAVIFDENGVPVREKKRMTLLLERRPINEASMEVREEKPAGTAIENSIEKPAGTGETLEIATANRYRTLSINSRPVEQSAFDIELQQKLRLVTSKHP